MSPLHVHIPGVPRPQGSKRHVGHGVMVESSKHLRPWRADAVAAIQAAMAEQGWDTSAAAVDVTVTWHFPRPKSHYGTGRNAATVKPSAPELHAVKPDADKLLRALLDALTEAGAVRDDARIATGTWTKAYDAQPATRVVVREYGGRS